MPKVRSLSCKPPTYTLPPSSPIYNLLSLFEFFAGIFGTGRRVIPFQLSPKKFDLVNSHLLDTNAFSTNHAGSFTDFAENRLLPRRWLQRIYSQNTMRAYSGFAARPI